MAAKKTGRKKSTPQTRSDTKAANSAKRQILSIVWFAVAIFFLCVTLIKGDKLWLGLHNVMFGIFGVTAYGYPILLGFIAVFYAMDKFYGSITAKVIESTVLIVLISAAVDIFTAAPYNGFFEYLSAAYKSGQLCTAADF